METTLPALPPRGLTRIFSWPRVKVAFVCGTIIGLMLAAGWETGRAGLFWRTILLAFVAMTVFGVFEQWPRQLPRWLARWVLQIVGIGVAMPIATFCIYVWSTKEGAPPFWAEPKRLEGFVGLTMVYVLFAPWAALAALLRQKDAFAREQALAFELERSQFERQVLDSRMRLLQAQVQPHFLFNTLANVRELVEAGSPQAPAVLNNLIAYLRAVVPRLDDPLSTVDQEMQLVRAYLEVMHMRMPDRLNFDVHLDDAARDARCPPMTLLTLVENAVRHGIDPSEEGGRIEIRVTVDGGRVRASVRDTGVGMRASGGSLGTGLSTLRERLQLVFGNDAQLRIDPVQPHGVIAEVTFPAAPASPD